MSDKKKDMFRRFTPKEIDALPGREVKEKRTRSSKTYSLGNGLYQAVVYPEAIHYRNENGEWEDIDHSLTHENGCCCDHSGDLSVQLFSGGKVTLRKKNHALSWQIVGAAEVEPHAENGQPTFPRHDKAHRIENAATYTNIFPDVDFICELKPNQFKDMLVFKTPQSLRPVEYLIHAEGLSLHQSASGEVVAICGNETIFRLPAPCVIDEDKAALHGSAHATLTQLGDTDWHWKCEVNNDFAANATFPLCLDPLVKTEKSTNAMSMAYTCSKKPTTKYPAPGNTLVANNDYSLGKVCTYLRFEDNALPSIDASYYVTAATLTMTTTADCKSTAVYLKEVQSAWDQSTITYNTRPAVSSEPLEFYMAPSVQGMDLNFNIANLVRKWYNGNNYGIMLETTAGGIVKLGGSASAYKKPYITINYVSLAGLEDYLTQDNIDCGRAGTAYIGLFNGNVVFAHQETSMNGNLMPVSISRFYNSCYRNVNPYGAGMGWKFSTQQSLHKETIGNTTYYVYMDADGTRHHFQQTSGKWKDLSGMQLTLTLGTDSASITDKGDNKMVFALPTTEFNNNYTNVGMLQSISDALGNVATFNHNSNRLLVQAKDAASRDTTVTVLNGLIKTIKAPTMPVVTYDYDEKHRLTSITHEDNKTTTYTYYNDTDMLETVTNHDGMSITLLYYEKAPFRVREVQFRDRTNVLYGGRRYTYGDCCTKVTELYPAASGVQVEGKSLFYHFNDAGNLVSVNDELGYGCFAGYSSGAPLNHPDFVSKMQRAVSNYLRNHHFISITDDWVADKMDGAGDCGYSSDNNYIGGRAYRLNKTSTTGRISVYQTVGLKKGKSYTLSTQFTTANNAAAQLRIEWQDSTGNTDYVESDVLKCTDQWSRISASFTLPTSAASETVKVRLMAAGGAGKVWVDAVQLEDGLTPNRYNMLTNGNFHMNSSGTPSYWTASEAITADDGVTASIASGRPSELEGNVVCLIGAPYDEKCFSQIVPYIGHAGDTFVAGGWSFSHCRPRNDSVQCYYEMEIQARPKAEDVGLPAGTTTSFRTVARVQWSEEWSGWQFAAAPVVMPWRYNQLQVRLVYRGNINMAQFSNLFLHKEEFGQTYTYDDNANVENVKNLAALESDASYDSYNNLSSYLQPGRTLSTEKYHLDWGDTEAKKKQHLLRKATSPMGIVQRTVYDVDSNVSSPKGLPIEHVLENSSGTAMIISKTEYTTDKNYVSKQIDARGKAVTTVTDPNRGIVTSVTDPKGQQVSYTHDTLGRVTVVQTSAADNEGITRTYRNEYTYTDDKLTKVAHNTDGTTCDVAYNFGYDSQNRRTTVHVGSALLSRNVYNTTKGDPLYGTLTRSEFGNGDQIRNHYDQFKRVVGVQFDSDTADRFTYEYGADGQVARVINNELNRVTLSENDRSSRPMRISHAENGVHLYSGEVTYDDYNRLESFREQVGAAHTAYSTKFTYDVENKPTLLKYNNSDTDKVAYAYDSLGRTSTRTVTVGGKAYASNYSYLPGGFVIGNGNYSSTTTNLILSIAQTGGYFVYSYDDNGNIASVMQDGKYTYYSYDALGQLIRVNDQNDTTSGSTGTTWVYAYDQGGNIKSKKRYTYTSSNVEITDSTPVLETVTFSYTNANWKDQLSAVNGVDISYDNIGNPTNDGTWSYTWEKGRQLKSMSKSGTTANFKYNENGLRIQKTVNGVETNYILHGKNIVHMTKGSNTLHFFYDASNKPAIVEYNGTKYAYVQNLQGDIVAILDSNGTAVVQYKYDAWGRPISKTGSMAGTLGTVQPFRYRGYVYDEETGLYYLRSRYYNVRQCRFANADVLYTDNLYSYSKNTPIIGVDKNGFAVVCCFDENGFERPFMTQVTMGGGGGGAGGYLGSVYANSKPEDVSILVATAKTTLAFVKHLSFEVGVGMGFVGDIDAIIANVGGGVRFDALNLSVSRNGIFFGEKAEFSMSLSAGIKGVDNASIGGSMTSTRTHSYSGCEADHALFDYLDCSHTESSFDTGKSVNLGVSAYLGVGATINLGLDIESLWNELLDIWVR